MKSEHRPTEPRSFARWLRATYLGWLLGLVLFAGLALICDLFGGEAQFMVGVGMGAGVGFLQGRLLRACGIVWWKWWGASAIGMGTPFILEDLFRLAGVSFPFSPLLQVVGGGLLVGLLQWGLLRSHGGRANWWIPASVAGWAVPAGAVALGDSGTLGSWGQLISPLGILLGGVPLGAVTGIVMVRLLRGSDLENWRGSSLRQADVTKMTDTVHNS